MAAVSVADSDTGFGRGNDAVDILCGVVEKDDVGSVVKEFSKCAGFTYVQAPQHQQDKRHTAVDVECGVEKDDVGSAKREEAASRTPQDKNAYLSVSRRFGHCCCDDYCRLG